MGLQVTEENGGQRYEENGRDLTRTENALTRNVTPTITNLPITTNTLGIHVEHTPSISISNTMTARNFITTPTISTTRISTNTQNTTTNITYTDVIVTTNITSGICNTAQRSIVTPVPAPSTTTITTSRTTPNTSQITTLTDIPTISRTTNPNTKP